MKKFTLFILLAFLSIFFTACSQKVTIKALKPSSVEDSAIKKISIKTIRNDDILLTFNIQSKMSNVRFNNKPYFTIINRKATPSILQEQKLQDSGLANLSRNKQFEVGEVESILSGSINAKQYDKSEFYEKRTNHSKCIEYKDNKNKKECIKYEIYNAICSNNTFTIRASLTINKVENTALIYSKNFHKQKVLKDCNDYKIELPPRNTVYNIISNEIANEFLQDISPSYEYFQVVLIDDSDIDYTDNQEKILDNALKLIEFNHLSKAELLLSRLVSSTKSKSSTALYNLGVVKEALGKLKEAYTLYKKAENISMLNNLDKNIMKAVQRIEESLVNNKRAMRQIMK